MCTKKSSGLALMTTSFFSFYYLVFAPCVVISQINPSTSLSFQLGLVLSIFIFIIILSDL